MKQTLTLKTSCLIVALLVWPAAQAATLGRDDYKAGKTRISADYQIDKKACSALTDNAKDVCIEQAKAKEKVARAELEFSYTARAADQNKVRVVKAKAAYAVAKEQCDDQAGNARDVCVKEAKAAEVKALTDAKMGQEIAEVRQDGAQDKRDADYKVALEKCDAMAGLAKTTCVTDAKALFGKS
jgi:hypothetical protein